MAIVSDLQTLHGFTGPTYQPFSTKTEHQDQGSYRGLKCIHSPKFASSFAKFSCSLLTHHLRRGGSTPQHWVLGPIWVSFNGHARLCGYVLTYSLYGQSPNLFYERPLRSGVYVARAGTSEMASIGRYPPVQCYMRVRRTWTLVLMREGIEVE